MNDHPVRIAEIGCLMRQAMTALEDGKATNDQAGWFYDMLCQFNHIAGEFKAMAQQALLDHIKANGDIILGEKRIYAAPNTNWRCRDNRTALEAVLNATDGDMDAVVGCLASQPFKQGTVRAIVGDEGHADLFEKVTTSELKEGVVRKRLHVGQVKGMYE